MPEKNHRTVEEWRPIADCFGYEVSDYGRVRRGNRLLRTNAQLGYYPAAWILPRRIRVHTLVLEAFVGPCPPGMIARHHPDSDPGNNRRENLSWAPYSVNEMDKVKDGTSNRGERHGMAKLVEGDIERIFDLRRAGCNGREIGEWFGVTGCCIRLILRGKRWGWLQTTNRI